MASSVALNFGAGVLFIVSAWYLPVTLVQGLLESVFLTLCAILAIFRKHCSFDLPIAVLLCYGGCLLLIQPEGIFNNCTSDMNCTGGCDFNATQITTNSTAKSCHSLQGIETLYGILAAVSLSLFLWIHCQFNLELLIKWTPVISIVFWIGLGSIAVYIPLLGILRQPILIPTGRDVGLLILFGIAFTVNIFTIAYASTQIPLSHVAIVLPSGLIFLYISQKTILKDIHPGPDNWLAILGLILTLCGTLLSPVCDIIRQKKASTKQGTNVEEQKHPMEKEELVTIDKTET